METTNPDFKTTQKARNKMLDDVETMWQDREGPKIIDIENIGYAFHQNKGKEPIFWNVTISIHLTGPGHQDVLYNNLVKLLQSTNVICHCLSIGIKNEGTTNEAIYALCVCQFSDLYDLFMLVIDKTSQIEINEQNQMAQVILQCCRRESSEYEAGTPASRILRNYGFEARWIHDSRDVQRDRELQREIVQLLERGRTPLTN